MILYHEANKKTARFQERDKRIISDPFGRFLSKLQCQQKLISTIQYFQILIKGVFNPVKTSKMEHFAEIVNDVKANHLNKNQENLLKRF